MSDPEAPFHILNLPQELVDTITDHVAEGLEPDFETALRDNHAERQAKIAKLMAYATVHRRFLCHARKYLHMVVRITSEDSLVRLVDICRDNPNVANRIKYIEIYEDLLWAGLPHLHSLLRAVSSSAIHMILEVPYFLFQRDYRVVRHAPSIDQAAHLRELLYCVTALTIQSSNPLLLSIFRNLKCLYLDRVYFGFENWTFPFSKTLVSLTISHCRSIPPAIFTELTNIRTLKIYGNPEIGKRYTIPQDHPPNRRLKVKQLHISECPHFVLRDMFRLYIDPESVTHCIDANYGVDQWDSGMKKKDHRSKFYCIQHVLRKCPNLRHLSLHSIVCPPGYALLDYTHSPSLEEVSFSYADANGPRVERILAPFR